MIGGSQAILLFGGMICICLISISVGAGLYFSGGDVDKLKDTIMKKKGPKSAAKSICVEGNVIYKGKCLKVLSDQYCKDKNNIFWISDESKKNTECIEIPDNEKGEKICRADDIGDSFSNYFSGMCRKMVKDSTNEELKIGNLQLSYCLGCIDCNDTIEVNTIYPKVPDETTGYTTCRVRNNDEKKTFCINKGFFYTTDNKCIRNIKKDNPILEVDFATYNKINLILVFDSFIESNEIFYIITEVSDNNPKEDSRKIRANKIKKIGSKKLFYFSTKSGGIIKKNSSYKIKAKLITKKRGFGDKNNPNQESLLESDFSNELEITTPCQKITDNHCRNNCGGLFCGPINDTSIDVEKSRRDSSLTGDDNQWPYFKKASNDKCDCVPLRDADRELECIKRLNAPKNDINFLKDPNNPNKWIGCEIKIKPPKKVNYLTADPLFISQNDDGERVPQNQWITTDPDSNKYYRVLIKWERPSIINNSVGLKSIPTSYKLEYRIKTDYKGLNVWDSNSWVNLPTLTLDGNPPNNFTKDDTKFKYTHTLNHSDTGTEKGFNTTVVYRVTPSNESTENADNSRTVESLPTIQRVLSREICSNEKEVLGLDSTGKDIKTFEICVKTGSSTQSDECAGNKKYFHPGFPLNFDKIRNKCIPYSSKYKNICSYSTTASESNKKQIRKRCPSTYKLEDDRSDGNIDGISEEQILSCDNYVRTQSKLSNEIADLRYLYSYYDKNCIMFTGDLRHPGQPRFLPFFLNKKNEVIKRIDSGKKYLSDKKLATIRITRPVAQGSPYLTHFGIKWTQTYPDEVGKINGGFFEIDGSREISANTNNPFFAISTTEAPGFKYDETGINPPKQIRKDNPKLKEWINHNWNTNTDGSSIDMSYIELNVELDLNTQYNIDAYSLCKNSLWNDPSIRNNGKNEGVTSKDNPFSGSSEKGQANQKIGLSSYERITITTGSVPPTDNPKLYANETEINVNNPNADPKSAFICRTGARNRIFIDKFPIGKEGGSTSTKLCAKNRRKIIVQYRIQRIRINRTDSVFSKENMTSIKNDEKNPLDEIIQIDYDEQIKLNKDFINTFNSNKSNKIRLIRYEDSSKPFCKTGSRTDIFCSNNNIEDNIISQCIDETKLSPNSEIKFENNKYVCKKANQNLFTVLTSDNYSIKCKEYRNLDTRLNLKCKKDTGTTGTSSTGDEHITSSFSQHFTTNEIPCVNVNTYSADIQYILEDNRELEPSTNYHYRIWSYNEDSEGNLRECPNYNFVSIITPDLPPVYQYHEFGLAECNGIQNYNLNYTPFAIDIKIIADGLNSGGTNLDTCKLFDTNTDGKTCSIPDNKKVWENDKGYYKETKNDANTNIIENNNVEKIPDIFKINDCRSYDFCQPLQIPENETNSNPTLPPNGVSNISNEIENLGRFNNLGETFKVGGTPDFINSKTNDPNELLKIRLEWIFDPINNDPNYKMYKKYPNVYKMNSVSFIIYYKKIGENNVKSQTTDMPELKQSGKYQCSATLFGLDPESKYIIKLAVTINSTFTLRNGYSLNFDCKNFHTIENDDFFDGKNINKEKYIKEIIDKEWIQIETRKLTQSDCSFYYTNLDGQSLYKLSSGNEIAGTHLNGMGYPQAEIGKILENNKCKAISELNEKQDEYRDKICQGKINYNIYCYPDCTDLGDGTKKTKKCKDFKNTKWENTDSLVRDDSVIVDNFPKSVLSWIKDNDDDTKIVRSARCLHKDYHNKKLRKWYLYLHGGRTDAGSSGDGGYCVLPVPGRWLLDTIQKPVDNTTSCYSSDSSKCTDNDKNYTYYEIKFSSGKFEKENTKNTKWATKFQKLNEEKNSYDHTYSFLIKHLEGYNGNNTQLVPLRKIGKWQFSSGTKKGSNNEFGFMAPLHSAENESNGWKSDLNTKSMYGIRFKKDGDGYKYKLSKWDESTHAEKAIEDEHKLFNSKILPEFPIDDFDFGIPINVPFYSQFKASDSLVYMKENADKTYFLIRRFMLPKSNYKNFNINTAQELQDDEILLYECPFNIELLNKYNTKEKILYFRDNKDKIEITPKGGICLTKSMMENEGKNDYSQGKVVLSEDLNSGVSSDQYRTYLDNLPGNDVFCGPETTDHTCYLQDPNNIDGQCQTKEHCATKHYTTNGTAESNKEEYKNNKFRFTSTGCKGSAKSNWSNDCSGKHNKNIGTSSYKILGKYDVATSLYGGEKCTGDSLITGNSKGNVVPKCKVGELTQDQDSNSICRTKVGSGYKGTDISPSGMTEFECEHQTRKGCDCGYTPCIVHADTWEYHGDHHCPEDSCKLVRSGKNADSSLIKGMHSCSGNAGAATYNYQCYRSKIDKNW
jgi:hypothetical protein